MFVALEKLKRKQISKIIVAVPERSIGGSFKDTNLTEHGFHSDWKIKPSYNLCVPGGESSKVTAFGKFLDSSEEIILCTHSTLRFAFEKYGASKFNNCLVAIDEFHHVSANYESKLGELVRMLIDSTNAHILAMTDFFILEEMEFLY